MSDTPNLGLPYIAAAQAQKHVTHNEAIRNLDAVVQLSIKDKDLTAPPGSPSDGDRYIVASGSSGLWTGTDNQIAAYQDNAWIFYPPGEGWLSWVVDEAAFYKYSAGSWSVLTGGGVSIAVEDEAAEIIAGVSRIDFSGAGVTATDAGSGEVLVTIPGGGGVSVAVEDEAVELIAGVSRIDFAGAGVTATDAGGGEILVTIPGGGGAATDIDGGDAVSAYTEIIDGGSA